MYFPNDIEEGEVDKLEFSAIAAASLMNLLRKQRDAFGLTLFDTDLRTHTKAKSSTAHYRLLLSYLDKKLKEDEVNRPTGIVGRRGRGFIQSCPVSRIVVDL